MILKLSLVEQLCQTGNNKAMFRLTQERIVMAIVHSFKRWSKEHRLDSEPESLFEIKQGVIIHFNAIII